jgi:monoamine oxidase
LWQGGDPVGTVDVVVVGAGIAGLACAQALVRRRMAVVVLEARERLGGRVHTLRLDDEGPIELGAQVVHGRAAATWEVLREAGIPAVPLPRSPELLLAAAGGHRGFDALGPAVPTPWQVGERLGREGLGDVPLGTGLEAIGLRGVEARIAAEWLAQVWAGGPDDLSACGVAAAQAGAGLGGDEYVVVPGYDRVLERLGAGLDVGLGCPVDRLTWRPGAVEAQTPGAPVWARAAAVTVPPSVVAAGTLRFAPGLPPAKAAAAARLPLADGIVVVVELIVPAQRSTHVLAVDGRGLWRSTAGSPVVVGVAKGAATAAVRSAARDLGALDGLLDGLLPWYRPGWLASARVVDWGTDPWSLGTYTYPRVGHLDAPRVWAAPVASTLFFAGEATAGAHGGGMVHGGLESGHRAAAEIAEVLTC